MDKKGERRKEEKKRREIKMDRRREEERGRKEEGDFPGVPTIESRQSKLIHTTRATRRYQNLGVSSNSKR